MWCIIVRVSGHLLRACRPAPYCDSEGSCFHIIFLDVIDTRNAIKKADRLVESGIRLYYISGSHRKEPQPL